MNGKTNKDISVLKKYIVFWIFILYLFPIIFTFFTYYGIFPEYTEKFYGEHYWLMTFFRTYKYYICWLPLEGAVIYAVLLIGSGYILGSVSYSLNTVFLGSFAVMFMTIPSASMFWYLDTVVAVGTVFVLSAVFVISFCAGLVGHDIHR